MQINPPKPIRETMEERAARFQRLMDKNRWTRAELARHLGVSRARVTIVPSVVLHVILHTLLDSLS